MNNFDGITKLLLLASLVIFSRDSEAIGPIAPKHWKEDVSLKMDCCKTARLDESGRVGGAMVFMSEDGKQFGLFALTYRKSTKDEWHQLLVGPIEQRKLMSFDIIAKGTTVNDITLPYDGIKYCNPEKKCMLYFVPKEKKSFKQIMIE